MKLIPLLLVLALLSTHAPLAFAQLAALRADVDTATGEVVWPVRAVHNRWLGLQLRLTVDPVDKGNNERCFVVAAAVKEVTFL